MERLLITKLVRTDDTRADLYAKGHQWPDLKLFDLSDLADVGIDFANLPQGEDIPCRFWALYEESEKLNKAGNPYQDVVALEAIDAPATSTSTDNSAILAELRGIRALLQVLVKNGLPEADMPDPTVSVGERIPKPETAPADIDDHFPRYGDGNPVSDNQAEWDAYHTYLAKMSQPPASIDALREWVRQQPAQAPAERS